MSNVVALAKVDLPEVHGQKVIEALEAYLEDARRGEIIAFGIVTIDPASRVTNSWTAVTGDHSLRILGALNRLQYRIQKQWDEANE